MRMFTWLDGWLEDTRDYQGLPYPKKSLAGVWGGCGRGINTLAVSHDGGVLYSGAGDGTLMAYHIQRDSRVLQKHGSSWKGGFL
jgi:WD40 repeat protein